MKINTSIRRRLLSTVITTVLAFPSAHAADGVSAQQLLIVQTITLQGGKNDYGVAVLDGVQAYLAQVNRQGGVFDR